MHSEVLRKAVRIGLSFPKILLPIGRKFAHNACDCTHQCPQVKLRPCYQIAFKKLLGLRLDPAQGRVPLLFP
jgi:hypothetical protein